MKPYILTPQGECLDQNGLRSRRLEGSKPVSLLKAWGEVRNWRRNFLNSEVEGGVPATEADLMHAHCFSAGMTAVRNSQAVIYSLYDFIENLPHAHGHKDHSWLIRSFAVAEQFVFTRAGAVVVHGASLREELLKRGCIAENVFLIPEPLSAPVVDFLLEPQSALGVRHRRDDGVVFFAPDVCLGGANAGDDCAAARPPWSKHADCLLEAFACVRREIRRARLFVATAPAFATMLLEKSMTLGVADAVFALSAAECGRAFVEADVIIALGDTASPAGAKHRQPEPSDEADNETHLSSVHFFGEHVLGQSLSGRYFSPEEASREMFPPGRLSTALAGMIAGVTVLAADTPSHRDLSPEGRGLLWFRPEDTRDLATRAAFLARNPDLCRSLATTARKHLIETRSPQAVGHRYDAVYQHVFARRRANGPTPAAGRLQPVAASL
jgi:hypothetical protein